MEINYLLKRFFFRLKNYGAAKTIWKVINFIFEDKKIDLDKLVLKKNESLENIFLRFGTDKARLDGKKTFYNFYKKIETRSKYPNYLSWILRKNLHDFDYEMGLNYRPIYEKYFDKIKNNNLKILEIGVAGGHSVASWYKFFKNSEIFGVDIKDRKFLQYKGERLYYEKLDCLNNDEVNNYIRRQKYFDIIIDDSYHDHPFFELNIKNFFKTLKSGGLYCLEDFRESDEKLKIIRDYNFKNKKKLTSYNLTMDEIFNLIKKKKKFHHEIFDKSFNKYLFKNVKNLSIYYPAHPSSALCIMEKL